MSKTTFLQGVHILEITKKDDSVPLQFTPEQLSRLVRTVQVADDESGRRFIVLAIVNECDDNISVENVTDVALQDELKQVMIENFNGIK